MTNGLQKPTGVLFHVDEVGATVRGWAFDGRSDAPAQITLWIDGVARAEFPADEYRADLERVGYRDGQCGFRFSLPAALCDGQSHELDLTCGTERVRMLPAPVVATLNPEAATVEGHLDDIGPDMCVTGWVDGADEVEIIAGGVVVATARADLPRPDLVLVGRRGLGFRARIDLAKLSAPRSTLVARCGSVRLAGSVMVEPERTARLDVEVINSVARLRLAGWPTDGAEVGLIVDGIEIGRCSLLPPAQAEVGGVLTGTWPLPATLVDGAAHVLQARGAGALEHVSSDAVLERVPEYRVAIDRVDGSGIAGWALKVGSRRSLTLEVRITGLQPFNVDADIPRDDVAHALVLDHRRVGFHFGVGVALTGRTAEILDAATGVTLARIRVDEPAELLEQLGQVAQSVSADNGAMARALVASARANMPVNALVAVATLPQTGAVMPGVDVVIPVFSGAAETVACIESVLSSHNSTEHRVILVNDRSPDPLICEYLRKVARENGERVILVERTHNGGFSEAVNIGTAVAGRRDVILLNADTVVSGNWIDRMVAIADADPLIATVTPFSNNGEICSVPYLCRSSGVASHRELEELDAHAAGIDARPIELPVAVGYCMLIRRRCLDEVGAFDAAMWGRGYGEEVDFCLKAAARGWRHVLAPNVFVIHRGGVSFGDEKIERIRESSRKIVERYPFYDALIQAFLRRDPPRRARRRISLAMLARHLPSKRVLQISHDFGGGTARYVSDMARLYDADGYANLQLNYTSDGRCRLQVDARKAGLPGLFMPWHEEAFELNDGAELVSLLSALDIGRVHLHAPFGVHPEVLQWAAVHSNLCATIHDYAWICPAVTLDGSTDGTVPCNPASCPGCAGTAVHPGLQAAWHRCGGDIARYRAHFAEFLSHARTVFVGGEDVRVRLIDAGVRANFRNVPHPRVGASPAHGAAPVAAQVGGDYRVALIGGLSTIKGFHRLVDCAREAERARLPLRFIVLGHTQDDAAVRALPNVDLHGRYAETDLSALIAGYAPDVALFLSQVPETFSYTLAAAFDCAVWPVVTDLGVPAERVRRLGFGDVLRRDASGEEIARSLVEIAGRRRSGGTRAPLEQRPTTLAEYEGA